MNVTEQWAQMTPEDAAILERSFELPSVLLQSDNIDARVMMAREVYAEKVWRTMDVKVTPALLAEYDCDNWRNLRQFVEAECGEVLA